MAADTALTFAVSDASAFTYAQNDTTGTADTVTVNLGSATSTGVIVGALQVTDSAATPNLVNTLNLGPSPG